MCWNDVIPLLLFINTMFHRACAICSSHKAKEAMKTQLLSSIALCTLVSVPLYANEIENPEPAGTESATAIEAPMVSEAPAQVVAQTTVNAEKPKFSIKPIGRILADGAVYFPDGNGFTDGVALPDLRVGVSASYGNWSGKIDVGFGYFKLSMKDVFIQYKFNDENLIRAGYFVHQFGLQASTSSSFKCAMEAPAIDNYVAGTGRNIGVMYNLNKPRFFMGVSAVFGNSANITEDKITRVSVGGLGRFVWRPIAETGRIAQVGVSAWYQSPTHKRVDGVSQPGSFTFGSNFPTRVVKVKMIGATVDNAGNQFKLSPELVLSKDRVALESQYYYMNVNRVGMPHYQAQGCYAWLRCLVLGESQYKYSMGDAGIATPSNKTLEIVAGYDYVNGSYKDIRGGISNDYSVTLNYYFNKYLLARLGYRYSYVHGSSVCPDRHVNMINLRLQFKF